MKRIGVAIVGTGWCGGIRAETCAANPLVEGLYLAEIRPERLAEVARSTEGSRGTLLINPTGSSSPMSKG